MIRKGSFDVSRSSRRSVSATERKQKSQSSYLQLMNNIAADLGVILDDLCTEPDEQSQSVSTILTPCNVQATSNVNAFNKGMFEPARNKSLNELQAERRSINDKGSSLPIDQISLTSSSAQVISPAQQSFLLDPFSPGVAMVSQASDPSVPRVCSSSDFTDFGLYSQSVPRVSSLTDVGSFGQAAPETSFTLENRLEGTRDIWYQPEITKNVAIKALQSAPLGSFMFRGSRIKGQLSLSVQQKSESAYYIENYPVKLYPDNSVELLKSAQVFKSATHLVVRHMTTKGCLPVLLRLPSPVMAADTQQDLQRLNCQATSVWRNSKSFQQIEDPNQNITTSLLEIPAEACRTMTRVKSTPQINHPNTFNQVASNQSNLIDLSNQTRTTLLEMPIRRSSSYNGSTNPFVNIQHSPNTAPPLSNINLQQTHQATLLNFRPNSDNYFWSPHNVKKEPQSQSLNPFQSQPTYPSHLPERDSGLPDNIREIQRLSVSPIQDNMSYFDPLADSLRDSGVYPNSQQYRDSVYSESGNYQTKSDDTILPTTSSKSATVVNEQSESVTHRKRDLLRAKQSSLDSLDETSRFSGVSSGSSGERFSLISTSSSEESAKNVTETTQSTSHIKAVKTPKYLKTKSIKKIKNAFGSFSKKKIKRESENKIKGNTDKISEDDVAEEAAECIERTVLRRSHECGTFLCMTIDEFISSKIEKTHEKPEEMMHSIRQLIGGMKRLLISMQGDQIIREVIQQNAHKLNQEVERVIESALYQRILIPLKETIYANYHHEYKRNGSIVLLEEKMATARLQTKEQLGIKANFVPPNNDQMKIIKECFHSLQEAYSPYDKMELILKAVMYIYDYVGDKEHGRTVQSMGADEFLPMLIYTLVQCDITTIEIETDYIWSLLEATAFTGEPAYYLTTLTSAVHVLKNVEFDEEEEEVVEDDNTKDENEEEDDFEAICRSPSVSGTKGFLEVVVTVTSGVFQEKMLPLWPGMSTKHICRNLTLKNHIEDKEREHFGLFKLERDKDGQVIKETLLQDKESPQAVKDEMTRKGTLCDFGFKHKFYRVDWPVNIKMIAEADSDESDEEDSQLFM